MIGVGGNLAAVQASRLSTALHRVGTPGHLPDNMSAGCVAPWTAFCGSSEYFISLKLVNPYTAIFHMNLGQPVNLFNDWILAVVGKLLFVSNFLQLLVATVKMAFLCFTSYKGSMLQLWFSKVTKLLFCYVCLAAKCDGNKILMIILPNSSNLIILQLDEVIGKIYLAFKMQCIAHWTVKVNMNSVILYKVNYITNVTWRWFCYFYFLNVICLSQWARPAGPNVWWAGPKTIYVLIIATNLKQ